MEFFAVALDYFVQGGACMWPLLACSIAVIVIGVERYLYLKKAISDSVFADSFCSLMDKQEIEMAKELAAQAQGNAAELAQDIFASYKTLGKRLESVVYTKVDRYIDSMHQYMNYLSVVIGLAPMLGLLGTITGMIASFHALNERGQNPMAVTAGIAEALITTVFGLCIAIVGMVIHAYLSSKMKAATLDLEEVAGTLSEVLSATQAEEK